MFRFFIDRPIFSSVISLIIVIAGVMAFIDLPISEYPNVQPPTVVITANYPGASAETISKTVAVPIEEKLHGIEGLLYFTSSSSADGTLEIVVNFETGTNPDVAAINTNNRVGLALPRLPEEVRRSGVTVQKRTFDFLMQAGLVSPRGSRDTVFLSNYALINMVDELKRVPGVGDVGILGGRDYAIRVWLLPDRMAHFGVTASDVATAIRAQNAQYAMGKIGQDPTPGPQSLVLTVLAQGRLVEPEAFGNIVLRASTANGILHLRDVARVELAAQNYDTRSRIDGLQAVTIYAFLQSGANSLATARLAKAKLEELSKRFPDDVEYRIPYDSTIVVSSSIQEVVITMGISALLVILVVFVFLQNWRSIIIPAVVIPVALIGTLAGLWLFNFSINQFSLFAIVLVIGMVVDDAIVVLENVERVMRTQGLNAREAAIASMQEVAPALVAIILVLCAVFVPVAFLGGIAGRLYQQFAVTIAVAVVISGVVALTLTPALCALLLKPSDHESALFRPFNRAFAGLSRVYNFCVAWVLRHRWLGAAMFIIVIAAVASMFRIVPTGFVPTEDRSWFYAEVLLPDGATLARTEEVTNRLTRRMRENPAVEHTGTTIGSDIVGGGNKTNASTTFVTLKKWHERNISAADLIKQFAAENQDERDGLLLMFNPSPIRGIGNSGSYEMYLQSRVDADPKRLAAVMQTLIEALKKSPNLAGVSTFFRPTTPQVYLDVDRDKALAMGVPMNELFDTISSTIGALYVNDFNKFGRAFKVQMQADGPFRMSPQDIGKMHVRGNNGAMIPLSALATARLITGPQQLDRYNGILAAKILLVGAPGVSSGDAIREVENVAAKVLPDDFGVVWGGLAFQEKRTGKASIIAVAFGIVMVFLILAALFETWSLPLAVILSVPFAMLGALIAVIVRNYPSDVYFQIGLVVLVGLASKNAILIVAFAKQKREQGMSAIDAATEAARLRFRPIVMTSMAFVLGVLPLVLASGAGSAARRSMGTGVFGGMIAATFIATAFIPLFYTWLSPDKKKTQKTTATPTAPVSTPAE